LDLIWAVVALVVIPAMAAMVGLPLAVRDLAVLAAAAAAGITPLARPMTRILPVVAVAVWGCLVLAAMALLDQQAVEEAGEDHLAPVVVLALPRSREMAAMAAHTAAAVEAPGT
jgi:hypothetical protein